MDKSRLSDPNYLSTLIEELNITLPHFDDGRIDYTNAVTSPVINCFIKHDDKILLLKRSNKVSFLKNKWHVIAGFLDEDRPIEDKIHEELYEELGFSKEQIKSIKLGMPIIDKQFNREWIVYPAFIEVNSDKIQLDWEHEEYKWITMQELHEYELLPNVKKNIEEFFEN